jgi:hypothetical protein
LPRCWAALRCVVWPHRCRLAPCVGVRLAVLSFGHMPSMWGVVPWRWATHIVVGSPTSVFACLGRRGVLYSGVGLPYLGECVPSSWWALLSSWVFVRLSKGWGVGVGLAEGKGWMVSGGRERRVNTSHDESRGSFSQRTCYLPIPPSRPSFPPRISHRARAHIPHKRGGAP